MSCPLCEMNRIDKLYYEDKFIYILSCDTCHVPLGILKRHTTEPTPFEAGWLESHLKKVGDEVLGKGKFRIDRKMRQLPDHTHYHARPI